MKTIVFANQKGGTGKTTTVISVGDAFARSGKRVLIADLDPQGHAAVSLNTGCGTLRGELADVPALQQPTYHPGGHEPMDPTDPTGKPLSSSGQPDDRQGAAHARYRGYTDQLHQ